MAKWAALDDPQTACYQEHWIVRHVQCPRGEACDVMAPRPLRRGHERRSGAPAASARPGRRLPTEAEWELAACTAESRGYVWGDVLEWVAGSARHWPGHAPVAGDFDPLPLPLPVTVTHGVLRGASPHTWLRARQAKSRRFVSLSHDGRGCGFRSCAA